MNKNKFMIFIVFIICFGLLLSGWPFLFEKPQIYEPTFSPDGQYLILSIKWKGEEAIYKVRKDGSELSRISASGNRYDFYPVYSSDGSKIVFCSASSDRPGTHANLYIMDADGSDRKQLTQGAANDSGPIFSSDGQQIYFVRAETFKNYSPTTSAAWHDRDVYSINVDGSGIKQLTHGKYYSISRPSLSPDGNHVLVGISQRDDSLWLISIDKPEEKIAIRPDLKKYLPDIKEKPWASEPFRYSDFYDPHFLHFSNVIVFIWPGHYQGYYGHEIYLWDQEKNFTKKLTELKSFITGIAISNDDSEIVFLKSSKALHGPSELWCVNTDGSNQRQIDIKFDKTKK